MSTTTTRQAAVAALAQALPKLTAGDQALALNVLVDGLSITPLELQELARNADPRAHAWGALKLAHATTRDLTNFSVHTMAGAALPAVSGWAAELREGRAAREARTRGGQVAGETRKQASAAVREKVLQLDATMDVSRKERAYAIAERTGLSERTVYDMLPRRRKSSRSS